MLVVLVSWPTRGLTRSKLQELSECICVCVFVCGFSQNECEFVLHVIVHTQTSSLATVIFTTTSIARTKHTYTHTLSNKTYTSYSLLTNSLYSIYYVTYVGRGPLQGSSKSKGSTRFVSARRARGAHMTCGTS